MEAEKIKATDYLSESLKLIVAISTVLFGGLLAYKSNVSNPIYIWAYFAGLVFLLLSSILSVVNINSLINKVYRNEDNAIKQNEVKNIYVVASVSLFIGIGFGAFFISTQKTTQSYSAATTGVTRITTNEITVGKGNDSVITVQKDSSGQITEVTITPK